MTVRVIIPSPRLTDAVAGHAYCLPVVRELPPPVADPAADDTW